MSILRNIIILGFVLAVIPVLVGSKAQQKISIEPGDKQLTNEQIKELLLGNSVDGQSREGHYYTFFFPTYGKMLGEISNGATDEGGWSVKDNMLCRTWNNWRTGELCKKVYTRGNQILLLYSSGRIAVQTLRPGNPENLY